MLYFDALTFANKNIESTSHDMDQLSIFNKFLTTTADCDMEIVARETGLLGQVGLREDITEGFKVSNTSKYISA